MTPKRRGYNEPDSVAYLAKSTNIKPQELQDLTKGYFHVKCSRLPSIRVKMPQITNDDRVSWDEWSTIQDAQLDKYYQVNATTPEQKSEEPARPDLKQGLNQAKLDDILTLLPTTGLSARTIHEVKGKQYQGMCVVLTTAKAKGIITHLEKEPDNSMAEDSRELYVAASRAQKLLVFACPKNQSKQFFKHISLSGATIDVTNI